MQPLASLKAVIRTCDLEASCEFYQQILGLELVESWDETEDRGRIFRLGAAPGTAFIELSEIQPQHPYYQDAFSKKLSSDKMDIQIATNDVDAWADRLRDLWVVRGPVDRPWGSRYLYLRDPDGVRIIIYKDP